MQFVEAILYRPLSETDYINIESVMKPSSGGGQTYIDLSAINKEDIVAFFDSSSAARDEETTKRDTAGSLWPGYTVPVRVIGTRVLDSVPINVRSASKGVYRNYRIAGQVIGKGRHAGWLPENGFPSFADVGIAPGGTHSKDDLSTAISKLYDRLTVFLVKTKLGCLYSGFIVGKDLPAGWPTDVGLEELVTGSKTGIIYPSSLLELHSKNKEVPFKVSNCEAYSEDDFLSEVFIDEDEYEAIVALLERKKNIILQGSPGTGKTFAAKRLAFSIMGAKDETCICSVQFHQSSAYEDYIYGFRPADSGAFEPKPGIFVEFLERASNHPDEKFFLIVDEINRANVSKVFGELLMAIEADHRDEKVKLPVGNDKEVFVPANVFIIGMMNTADRGLALIDYALRRRFAFVDVRPRLEHPVFEKLVGDSGSAELAKLVDRVKELNAEIEEDPSLGPGFMIGHSYLCLSGNVTAGDVRSVIDYELAPLVKEYWYDQPDTAQLQIENLRAALS